MDLLVIFDENKSQCVYIKDFGRFMFHKTKNKKKLLRELFYSVLVVKIY